VSDFSLREPTCQELAELLTDYLEGLLAPSERASFDRHIAGCRDCTLYVEQMRLTRFSRDPQIMLWHARGCSQCANTGYVGRVCITEMMPMTDALRSLVMRHANAADLRAEAIRCGMVTMYEDGLRKAVKGVTTFEEVLRATRED